MVPPLFASEPVVVLPLLAEPVVVLLLLELFIVPFPVPVVSVPDVLPVVELLPMVPVDELFIEPVPELFMPLPVVLLRVVSMLLPFVPVVPLLVVPLPAVEELLPLVGLFPVLLFPLFDMALLEELLFSVSFAFLPLAVLLVLSVRADCDQFPF